jgi:hypothetical protein
MVLAIHIWRKLRKSIPLWYREYYSLLPDAAAGKVTVVARIPSLKLPGLWSTTAESDASRKTSSSRFKFFGLTVTGGKVLTSASVFSPSSKDSIGIFFRSFKITK